MNVLPALPDGFVLDQHGGSLPPLPQGFVLDQPHQSGALSNSSGDGYISGAAKGLGTAAIKGLGNSVGFVGNIGNFADYLLARGESAITGKKVDDILKDMKATQSRVEDNSPFGRVLKATNPRNVLPSGEDVSAPILAKTGEYTPTSEPGRLAQAGAEAAFSAIGPGAGGAAGPARAILSGALKTAVPNAVAGAAGQGATDATGDPLIGLGAGLGAAGVAQGAGAVARRIGGPAIAGIPGIDRVPVIGPRVAAATDTAVARRLLDQSSDQEALRNWAQQDLSPSDVPDSPRTTAGAVGNDRGLFQAEKDARNVNNLPFNAADRAQSDAQMSTIRGMQPDGDVFLPGQMIRARMDAIDSAAQEVEDRLSAAHQDFVTRRGMASQSYADQQRAALADRQDTRRQAASDFADRARADLNERTIARGEASGDAKARADSARQAAHDRLVAAFQDASGSAEQRARDAAAGLGDRANAEDLGSTLRSAMEEVRAGVKQAHNDLYSAVDPDGTLALVATPVRDRATQIGAQLRADGSEFDPAEAGLFRRAASLPDVIPYRMLHTLDKDITAAMSKERRGAGETPALARLSQLKGAVKDAMTQAADNQARHEAGLVDAGLMEPEDTLEARVDALRAKWAPDFESFRSDASGSVARTGTGPFGFSGGGTSRDARPDRTAGATDRGIGQAPSDQGISPPSLQPSFDEAATQRLRDANAAYGDYARTYKNPIIAPGLKTTGFAREYRIPDAVFLRRAIVPGDKGLEAASAHLAAVRNDPRAVAAMQNAILDPLRKTTLPTGTIHPNALARWKESYGPALRAIDAVAPGFSSHFDSAAEATQSLLDIGAQHRQELADHERNAARQAVIDNIARREKLGQATRADRDQVSALMAERAAADRTESQADKARTDSLLAERTADDRSAVAQSKADTAAAAGRARDIAKAARETPAGQFAAQGGDRIAPTEVENAVGNLLKTGTSGATRMRSLVDSVSSNPDALSGLRRAGVDWLIRTHQNADGTLSGARFINFIRDNKDTLKELFPADQLGTFSMIARDIEVNSRWRTQTAIKGGSDTAKNVKPMLEKTLDQAKRHFSIMSAATAGFLADGTKGALTGAGLYLFNSLRSAGIRRVDDLYREALLRPEVAKLLISKMPDETDLGKLRQLSGLLQRAVIVGAGQTGKKQ
jgi:hypothetical protein